MQIYISLLIKNIFFIPDGYNLVFFITYHRQYFVRKPDMLGGIMDFIYFY